jgi:hypothetical protein
MYGRSYYNFISSDILVPHWNFIDILTSLNARVCHLSYKEAELTKKHAAKLPHAKTAPK